MYLMKQVLLKKTKKKEKEIDVFTIGNKTNI
jgi:hypothetical protein